MALTFSVVLANYNHARYLPESLGAVVAQSVLPKEFIVVDDGSTDGSMAVIDDFACRYPFIRVLRNPKNMGAMYSFNLGLAQATGDFVIFPAADDRFGPGLFEKSMELLARYPEAGLCSSMGSLLGPQGEELGPLHTPVVSRTSCYIPPSEVFALQKREGNWILSQTAFCNRKALQEWGGGYDPELGPAADAFMVYVLAARHGACFIPERLGSWRKLESSFALRNALDVAGALRLAELLDKKLRATGLFPDDFLERSMRSTLLATIYEFHRRQPYALEDIAAVASKLLRKDWTDRAFISTLALCKPAGRWATKIYLFLNHPPRERCRIAGEKLKKLLA